DAERGQRERDAVPERERAHRDEEAARRSGEQDEPEHEEEMIRARQEVRDAQPDVIADHVERARAGRDGENGVRRGHHPLHQPAVGERHADERAVSSDGGTAVGWAMASRLPGALAALLLAAPGGRAAPPPWQRIETRQPCTRFDLFRQPFFGDLHIHTRFSADSYIFGTRVGPQDAYGFATGAPITLADDDELQTRSSRIDRPLDFAAVTDHSEWFGEVRVCDTPSSSVYDSNQCQILRSAEPLDQQFRTTVAWLYTAGIPTLHPSHLPLCTEA